MLNFAAQLWTDVLIGYRNLVQHSKRTLFLGGAIAAVTALLVLLTGLSTGIRETMLKSATTLMSGHVNVGGFYKVTAGQSAPVVTDYARVVDVVKKAGGSDIDYVTARGRGWAKVVSDTGSMQAGIGGIDIDNEPNFKQVVRLTSGKLEDLRQPRTMLVFENQAKKLDVKVGDTVTLSAQTTRGTNMTVDVRIVAVAKDIGLFSSFNTYVPAVTLRELYQLNAASTGAIYVYLKDMRRIPVALASIRAGLEGAGYRLMDPDPKAFWMKFDVVNREDWTGQKLDLTTWEDEISFVTWVLSALGWLTGLLIGILLVIVVIGIMNTMWIAIRERTREIGTLRAIGMQRGRVMWMFLAEALMLGVAGTGTGAVAGALLAVLVNAAHLHVPLAAQLFLMSDTVRLATRWGDVAGGIAKIVIFTGLAALWPALRAARLKPVTAMTHFG